MWILVLVVLFFVLKSMSRHATKGTVGTKTTYLQSACSGVGDSFIGPTTVAGVPEPPVSGFLPSIHCCHIVAHFPVDPPPIAIQVPVAKTPSTVGIHPKVICNIWACEAPPLPSCFGGGGSCFGGSPTRRFYTL
jgi:hypothetical protein